jgi:N-acyl-D-amino-acid deacylase
VNVGTLIGHSTVRHYVMGDECQGRAATPEEIEAMRGIVRDAIQAGALGLSVSRNRGHYDPQGTLIPALWAVRKKKCLPWVMSSERWGLALSRAGADAMRS